MEGDKAKYTVGALIAITTLLSLIGLFGLLKPIQNGCTMTYMYPTYIPISAPKNLSSNKYGLFLYHEGWKKIDFNQHIKQLNGVPVLFIPGNGGSYKQVRSLAKESHWAYTSGPPEHTYYQEASLSPEEGGLTLMQLSLLYPINTLLCWTGLLLIWKENILPWMVRSLRSTQNMLYMPFIGYDILDLYTESFNARTKEGASVSGNLPKSVVLVGHSMGGFVARAAVVNPNLRKSSVETIVTLSSPHQSPPLALQPSLGYYYTSVNQKWREGYHIQAPHTRTYVSHPSLSRVVVISISGGINDYQVRSKLETLDGIVPPTHGFMVSSMEMKNVWLSMEHQAILWCNQLVVQVSHTLLSLVDPETRHPYTDRQLRLAVFTKMLYGGLRHGSSFIGQSFVPQRRLALSGDESNSLGACPESVQWDVDSLERDLYIQTSTVTVLAMDGRRRWLDIQKLGSNGNSHFVLVTNLSPCHGVRVHLWPEKGNTSSDLPLSKRVVEVTSTMAQIPSGPPPRQIEPGSQTEQPPPSSVFWLSPETMQGFRFITVSVAPRPSVSGRPPPAASMAVGQFFNLKEGIKEFSSLSLLLSAFLQNEILFKEDHPIALNLSFTISLGILPVTISLKTAGCGIKNSEISAQEDDDAENNRLCKMRCFPAVAFAWDRTSGLHIYPNLNSETVLVDSAPALWHSAQGSEKTTVLLLVDPHCAYKAGFSVSITAATKRFLLLYTSKVLTYTWPGNAVVFFALMRQARAWELDLPIPSVLTAVEYNLKLSSAFFLATVVPLLVPFTLSVLQFHPIPIVLKFSCCVTCLLHGCKWPHNHPDFSLTIGFPCQCCCSCFLQKRWQASENNFWFGPSPTVHKPVSRIVSFKVVRVIRSNPTLMTALVSIILVSVVHPALGLLVLLMSHSLSCHSALCSYLTASSGGTLKTESFNSKDKDHDRLKLYSYQHSSRSKRYLSLEENQNSTGVSSNSYGDIQLEVFHHRHGLLILHLLAMLMFVPSLVAWLQRIGIGQSFPWFLDSILCMHGVILHGFCDSTPELNFFVYSIPGVHGLEVRLSFAYLLAGYFSFLSG
ncbi:GPI inositol-deacylase [Bienertia sinuspersici]